MPRDAPVIVAGWVAQCLVAALAWRVSRHSVRHIPFAAFATFAAVSDLVRAATSFAILHPYRAAHGDEPYVEVARAAFHLDQSLFISYPIALLALCATLHWMRDSWAHAVGLVGMLEAVLVLGYPELRGHALARVYLGIDILSVVGMVGFVTMWLVRGTSRDRCVMSNFMMVGYATAETAACGSVFVHGVFDRWSDIAPVYLGLQFLAVAAQGMLLWQRRMAAQKK